LRQEEQEEFKASLGYINCLKERRKKRYSLFYFVSGTGVDLGALYLLGRQSAMCAMLPLQYFFICNYFSFCVSKEMVGV
jgi:hypothetical protein